MGKGRAVSIVLDDPERQELQKLTRKHGAPQSIARRARVVLAAAKGLTNKEIAKDVGFCASTVGIWRNRYAERRLDGLFDQPRPGAPRQIGDDAIAETIRKTLETLPAGRHPLELPRNGARDRPCSLDGSAHLQSVWSAATKAYIDATHADPKPFRWTKTTDDILQSVKRFCLRTLEDRETIKRTSDSGQ